MVTDLIAAAGKSRWVESLVRCCIQGLRMNLVSPVYIELFSVIKLGRQYSIPTANSWEKGGTERRLSRCARTTPDV